MKAIENDMLKLPENVAARIEELLTSRTLENFHKLMVELFCPFKIEVERGNHPVGWFVHFVSKKIEGDRSCFASLSKINHTLVHLIHLVRLITYNELIKKPNPEMRKDILSMVQITFVVFYYYYYYYYH